MTGPLAPTLLFLKSLPNTIDAVVELIEALATLLHLPGRCLRLGQRLLGSAVRRLQLRLERTHALADRRDLLAYIFLRGAAAEAGRGEQAPKHFHVYLCLAQQGIACSPGFPR